MPERVSKAVGNGRDRARLAKTESSDFERLHESVRLWQMAKIVGKGLEEKGRKAKQGI